MIEVHLAATLLADDVETESRFEEVTVSLPALPREGEWVYLGDRRGFQVTSPAIWVARDEGNSDWYAHLRCTQVRIDYPGYDTAKYGAQ